MHISKQEFLTELEQRLSVLSDEERQKSCGFYEELIDDKIEDGEDEFEAVDSLGEVEEIAAEILSQTENQTFEHGFEKLKSESEKGLSAGYIIMLVFTSPFWIVFAAMVYILIICMDILFLCVVIIWAAFALVLPAGIVQAVISAVTGDFGYALEVLGMGFFFGGIALATYFSFVKFVKWSSEITVKLAYKFSVNYFGAIFKRRKSNEKAY